MAIQETTPTESPAEESVLPGALTGLVTIVLFAVHVIGLAVYDRHIGSTALTLLAGGAVYLATKKIQDRRRKASRPST